MCLLHLVNWLLGGFFFVLDINLGVELFLVGSGDVGQLLRKEEL